MSWLVIQWAHGKNTQPDRKCQQMKNLEKAEYSIGKQHS
jgi:hypothetical protein